MKHAHHVLRAVLGHVSIKEPAACHVLLLVSAFRATSVAPKISPAIISVLAYVAKTVPQSSVAPVVRKAMLEWIFLR
jgi:hypothetical protein